MASVATYNREPHLLRVLKYVDWESHEDWKLYCNACKFAFWVDLDTIEPDLSFCPRCSDRRRLVEDHERGRFVESRVSVEVEKSAARTMTDRAFLDRICTTDAEKAHIEEENRMYDTADAGLRMLTTRSAEDSDRVYAGDRSAAVVANYDRERDSVFVAKGEVVVPGVVGSPVDMPGDFLSADEFLYALDLWRDPAQPCHRAFKVPEVPCVSFADCRFQKVFDRDRFALETTWTDGVRFGGPWAARGGRPLPSAEVGRAMLACRAANREALWALPFPKLFVLRTIPYGHARGIVSLPFSAALCAWMKRRVTASR
jgi:hypothetical protein